MRTTTVKAGTSFTYQHPGERDGEPQQVAKLAAGDLDEASAIFARHVVAATRQVRSGFLSHELSQNPDLTPPQLAAAWDASEEAKSCLALVRAMKAANTATRRLLELAD